MNSTTQQVHDLLRNANAPTFTNPDHQAKLLRVLLERHSEEAEQPTPRSPWFRQRMVWAAAMALLLVAAIGLPLRGLFAPTRVWAEVLTALEDVDSFVITTTHYPEGASDEKSVVVDVGYFREGKGMAMHTAWEKVWLVESAMYRYNEKANEATIIRGVGVPPVEHLFGEAKKLTGGWGVEQDRGALVRDGKAYRLLEVADENDPTERVEVFYEPESMLPLIVVIYRRNTGDEPWRVARQDTIDYNVEIEDAVFVPAYPDTAKVTERALTEAEMAGAESDSTTDDAWMARAAAIVYHGEKYLAVEDVWMSPSGGIGLKFRTNLSSIFLFTCPAGFHQDPVNQERWDADEAQLYNLVCGESLVADPGGVQYRGRSSIHTYYPDDTQGFVHFYEPHHNSSPSDDFQPNRLFFRMLTIVRDKARGESMAHYLDWKNEPGKWQMLELAMSVPEPTLTFPASFFKSDSVRMEREKLEAPALQDHLAAMRRDGLDQEAYAIIKDQPEEVQRLYGRTWLNHLRELGKADEAYALFRDGREEDRFRAGVAWIAVLYELKKEKEATEFFEQYKEYCARVYGDNAHHNIGIAESCMKRFAEDQ